MDFFTPALRRSCLLYLALLAFCTAGIAYGMRLSEAGAASLRIWTPENILWLLPGLAFLVWHLRQHPDSAAKPWRGWWALLLGMAFGLLDVALVYTYLYPTLPQDGLPPFLQPFPYSIFLYTAGAFEVEVFYRLLPLTLFLAVGKWVWQGRHAFSFQVAGVILTALREPLEQWPDGPAWLVVYAVVSGVAMNAIQAYWFYQRGFWSALIIRLGHYLIWHIGLGIWVEFFR